MKTFIWMACVAAMMAFTSPMEAAAKESAKEKKAKAPKLRHVVSFKFKETATPKEIDHLVEAFAALKSKVPQVKKFEWGTNMSPEKLDKGLTHVFILTFDNAADRDAYLVHPAHKEFGKLVGPIVADVMVVDFVAKKKAK